MEINPRRVEQQLRNFQKAIEAYDHVGPFARFLTKFFKENKQMGSSDRRMTSRLCYNFFRLGGALPDLPILDRVIIAEFLCETKSDIVALYYPDWLGRIEAPLTDKIHFLQDKGYDIVKDLFPFSAYLSPAIDKEKFACSHLVQPDLFIRVPKQNRTAVEKALTAQEISYTTEKKGAYRLANGAKLQHIPKIQGLFEIQDLSSQESLHDVSPKPGERWWDTCAASGGKSLLLLDLCPEVDLLVSDIRLSILRNLDERFEKAAVKTKYRKKVLDLTQHIGNVMGDEMFDSILVDAPCSGSGTWGRTPEMLSQFDVRQIQAFATLQRKIVDNVMKYLKPNGMLIYITCSVFEAENEELVSYIQSKYNLSIEGGGPIKGYDRKSDSMFAVRLRNS